MPKRTCKITKIFVFQKRANSVAQEKKKEWKNTIFVSHLPAAWWFVLFVLEVCRDMPVFYDLHYMDYIQDVWVRYKMGSTGWVAPRFRVRILPPGSVWSLHILHEFCRFWPDPLVSSCRSNTCNKMNWQLWTSQSEWLCLHTVLHCHPMKDFHLLCKIHPTQ